MLPRLLLFHLLIYSSMLPAVAQVDDFSDGNDDGWTRYDPIVTLMGSPYALYQVQFGQYRLSSDPSPSPSMLGPARVGSYRADTVLTDFTAVVDVVSWNAALDQAFGLLARVQSNPGPSALNGYSLNYQPIDQDIEITRFVGETPVKLARVAVNLAPGDAYRFVFTGTGNQLRAAVYNLAEPLLPLVTLAAVDGTFVSGHCGLFCFATTNTGAVNVTFDSYSAGPVVGPVLTGTKAGPDFVVEWPRRTGAWHLEVSPDLIGRSDVTMGGAVSGEVLSFTEALSGRKFYRLAEGWPSP